LRRVGDPRRVIEALASTTTAVNGE
jgi:hypothetical protein